MKKSLFVVLSLVLLSVVFIGCETPVNPPEVPVYSFEGRWKSDIGTIVEIRGNNWGTWGNFTYDDTYFYYRINGVPNYVWVYTYEFRNNGNEFNFIFIPEKSKFSNVTPPTPYEVWQKIGD